MAGANRHAGNWEQKLPLIFDSSLMDGNSTDRKDSLMVDFNRDRLIAARRLASQIARSTEELLWVASEDSSKCNNALATKVEIIRATKLLSDTLDKGESAIKSTKPALLPYAGEFTIKGFESFTPVHLLAWEYGCRVWDCVNGIIESRVVNLYSRICSKKF